MDVPSQSSTNTIQADLPCIECGYNLRGLDPSGRCPECGTEISRSARGDLLKFANPDWLKKALRGTRCFYYALTFGFLVGVSIGFIAATAPGSGETVFLVLLILVGVLTVSGVYLTTTQEPRSSFSGDDDSRRGFLRALAVVNFALILLGLGVEEAGSIQVMFIVELAGMLSALALVFAYFGYMQGLADRVPDAKLRKAAGSAKWGLTIANVIVIYARTTIGMFAGGLLGTPGSPGVSQTFLDVSQVLALIGGLLYLIYLIRGLRVLLRFRKAFKSAITEAKAVAADPGLAPP